MILASGVKTAGKCLKGTPPQNKTKSFLERVDQDIIPHVTKKVVYNFKIPDARGPPLPSRDHKTAEV